jgi:hypothetical protein
MPATAGKRCNGQAFKPGSQEKQINRGHVAHPIRSIRRSRYVVRLTRLLPHDVFVVCISAAPAALDRYALRPGRGPDPSAMSLIPFAPFADLSI